MIWDKLLNNLTSLFEHIFNEHFASKRQLKSLECLYCKERYFSNDHISDYFSKEDLIRRNNFNLLVRVIL